jgi:protein tyrosine phosphatase (PTP) superfamily phosphohydrolase (DUF442 family)
MTIWTVIFPFCVLCCTSMTLWAQTPLPAADDGGLPTYSEISPRLGIGAQPTDDGFRRLAQMGYGAVVNLRTNQEKIDLAAEEKLVTGLGLKYYSIPVVSADPREEQALQFVNLMRDLDSRKVFVHCVRAVRASAFVMIDLVVRQRMDLAQAEKLATNAGLTSDVLRRFARQVIDNQRRQ